MLALFSLAAATLAVGFVESPPTRSTNEIYGFNRPHLSHISTSNAWKLRANKNAKNLIQNFPYYEKTDDVKLIEGFLDATEEEAKIFVGRPEYKDMKQAIEKKYGAAILKNIESIDLENGPSDLRQYFNLLKDGCEVFRISSVFVCGLVACTLLPIHPYDREELLYDQKLAFDANVMALSEKIQKRVTFWNALKMEYRDKLSAVLSRENN
eukprot:NODE_145_length_17646_cov_0.204536.p7 type:complete len:210 gc:universal NODE_145_length_17646_cov_0.204536:16765-16136(-)